MNWAYDVTPSAFRRRGICGCGFTTLMSVAAERHNSLKSFLLSASLVAAQLCWLIVVFLLSSFAWSLSRPCSRDWMHTNLYLWLIVVLLRYHCFCILIQLNCVVQVEPKVLAAVGHDRRSSRWSHYHLCSFDNGVHRSCRFALRRRWSLVSQMSWSIFLFGFVPTALVALAGSIETAVSCPAPAHTLDSSCGRRTNRPWLNSTCRWDRDGGGMSRARLWSRVLFASPLARTFMDCFHSNISLISKCPKHVSSIEKETARDLNGSNIGDNRGLDWLWLLF